MIKVLNPDGTEALTSLHPEGYPEAPPGYFYISPSQHCQDFNCSGNCWEIYQPKSISNEQFVEDMQKWRINRYRNWKPLPR